MTPQQCQNLLKNENKKYGKTMRLVHQDPKAAAGQQKAKVRAVFL